MRLLVVEDELPIRNLLVQVLEAEGYLVVGAGSAEAAMLLVNESRFDAFLLDVRLPGLSGTDLCRWLRSNGIRAPILMLTALSGLSEKVAGLDAGADDYLTKPFEAAEVKARLRAFHRQTLGYPRSPLGAADLVFDPQTQTASRGGKVLDLSPKELQLLDYLLKNRDHVVNRTMIAAAVWNSKTSLYTNVIDVFISNLRRKIDDGADLKLIHTVRGRGFLLSEAPGRD